MVRHCISHKLYVDDIVHFILVEFFFVITTICICKYIYIQGGSKVGLELCVTV